MSLFGLFVFTKEHVADFTIISLHIDDQMLSKRFLVVFVQFQVQFFWLNCQFRRYRHLWAHESGQLVCNAERIYDTVRRAWFGFYVINLFPWELQRFTIVRRFGCLSTENMNRRIGGKGLRKVTNDPHQVALSVFIFYRDIVSKGMNNCL